MMQLARARPNRCWTSTISSSNIGLGNKTVHAVSGVSLQVARGETLGLVGESGCGKSTLGRAVLQLRRAGVRPRAVRRRGSHGAWSGEALRKMRRRVQLIFQDPIASLNPRRRIGDIVAEPLIIAGVKDAAERERRVHEVLVAVGLDPDLVAGRLPHEFSGGQCQRICIARALVLNPEFIVCDEPVSALDVSIRAQILNLLEEMKARFGLTLLFIAHDLAVVKAVSDRVAVMYLGRLCEVGAVRAIVRQACASLHAGCCWRRSRCPIRTCVPSRAWRSASRHRRLRRRPAAASAPAARAPISDAARRYRSCARSCPGSSWLATIRWPKLRQVQVCLARPPVAWWRDERRMPGGRHEEFQGRRFQGAAAGVRRGDAATIGHAGADQGEGRRRLPQRSPHLGRRLRSRPWPQAAVAERPRHQSAADHGP